MNYRDFEVATFSQEDTKALLRPFVDNKIKLIFETSKYFIAK